MISLFKRWIGLRPNLLLVEHDSLYGLLVMCGLKEYHCVSVGTGAVAMTVLEHSSGWDCVVVDQTLSDTSGVDLVASIKRILPNQKCILLSQSLETLDQSARIDLSLRADAVVTHPTCRKIRESLTTIIQAHHGKDLATVTRDDRGVHQGNSNLQYHAREACSRT